MVQVLGQLTYPETANYAFSCNFTNAQLVLVWIDDHLVCHSDPPFGNTPSSTDGCPENPLVGTQGQSVPVLVHVYSNAGAANDTTGEGQLHVDIKWQILQAPSDRTLSNAPVTPVPTSALLPTLPAVEVRRRALQDGLKNGWNVWSYNMLSAVRLPQSCGITTAICQLSSGKCLENTHIEDPAASIRVGPFATDLSYWQFYLGFAGINVSISVLGGEGPLSILADPVNCEGDTRANCSDYALVVSARFYWYRNGTVDVDEDKGAIAMNAFGLDGLRVQTTAPGQHVPLPEDIAAQPHVAVTFDKGAIGIQEAAAPSLPAIESAVAKAKAAELARYAKYGSLAEVKEAVQAATMWNYIYTPAGWSPE